MESALAAAPEPPTFGGGGSGGGSGALMASTLRLIEEVHSEVEFEWLRPWGVQGTHHAETHAGYWAPRMAKLHAAWLRMEARTAAHLGFLAAAAAETAQPGRARAALPEGVRCFDVLLGLLQKRQGLATQSEQKGRAGWAARAASREYLGLGTGARPFTYPRFAAGEPASRHEPKLAAGGAGAGAAGGGSSGTGRLAMPCEELGDAIAELTRHRASFARNTAALAGGKASTAAPGGPTKIVAVEPPAGMPYTSSATGGGKGHPHQQHLQGKGDGGGGGKKKKHKGQKHGM